MSINTKLINVAIIPDGNRRWARNKGMHPFEGHRYAVEKTTPKLLDTFIHSNIKTLTLWLLSTENFNRSKLEIDNLLRLIEYFLDNKKETLHRDRIRFLTIGSNKRLGERLNKKIEALSKETEKYERIFCCAIDYGGRDEIIRAFEKIRKYEDSKAKYSKELINEYLDTFLIGEPDLIIRTGGEKRLSGFMLWQSEYSELYFTDTLFPDFLPEELNKALSEFKSRERRFGK